MNRHQNLEIAVLNQISQAVMREKNVTALLRWVLEILYREMGLLRGTVTLRSQAEIEALFCMTPYYYKTGARDQAKLRALDTLTTETEFALLIYNKA